VDGLTNIFHPHTFIAWLWCGPANPAAIIVTAIANIPDLGTGATAVFVVESLKQVSPSGSSTVGRGLPLTGLEIRKIAAVVAR
jgi:ABC-type Co2+ transport system permease subunit